MPVLFLNWIVSRNHNSVPGTIIIDCGHDTSGFGIIYKYRIHIVTLGLGIKDK